MIRKAWARIEFWVELPNDDLAADNVFDQVCTDIIDSLNNNRSPAVLAGSFSMDDADTTSEELED